MGHPAVQRIWQTVWRAEDSSHQLLQALAERRVTLVVNQEGVVQQVDGGSEGGADGAAIFGFDANILVGRNVGTFVDVFRSAAGA